MIDFAYFRPREDILPLAGSYYDTVVENAFSDVMRAEIANIRFILKGTVYSGIGGTYKAYPAGTAILCGPTYQWSAAGFDADTQLFGAAVTPLGWARMFGVPAEQLSDQIVDLLDVIPGSAQDFAAAVFSAPDGASRAAACDELFAALCDRNKRVNTDFLRQVTVWITNPDPNELDDLLAAADLSARQVERLCKLYLGSAPKLLHRKFRALHSANRLTWQDLTDWRDIATTAYFDQSHFIREFKHFNGRTPSEFINGAHLLVRRTLKARLQIAHGSPFSLVG